MIVQRAGLPTDTSLRDKLELYYEFVSPNEATLERADPQFKPLATGRGS
jgi:hypothetical protein